MFKIFTAKSAKDAKSAKKGEEKILNDSIFISLAVLALLASLAVHEGPRKRLGVSSA